MSDSLLNNSDENNRRGTRYDCSMFTSRKESQNIYSSIQKNIEIAFIFLADRWSWRGTR
jgi:hypothetical protein